ncbi:hypothetical protein EYF80_022465 [Liparis tanakae]|uniref:Uncharacterized protein n=1 Tax=Liparis tanakae TaxID=230148 RepID=A0A4Z2HNC7_9TELE|nr:hypothetical protein EYF80_022465 [Liparis tanakae]
MRKEAVVVSTPAQDDRTMCFVLGFIRGPSHAVDRVSPRPQGGGAGPRKSTAKFWVYYQTIIC